MKIYQTISLRTLAAFSLSMCNGSHRPAESKGKQKRTENKETRQCGSALSAEPFLKTAVTKLCSVKKINVGKVTAKLDAIFITNSTRADARRESKKAEEIAAETRRLQKKGVKFNKNIEEPLAASIGDLLAYLKAMLLGYQRITSKGSIMPALCVPSLMGLNIPLLAQSTGQTPRRQK